jgi:hypothetical protein
VLFATGLIALQLFAKGLIALELFALEFFA